MKENQNLILAVVLSLAIFLLWQHFIGGPQQEAQRRLLQQQQAAQTATPATPELQGVPGSASTTGVEILPRADAIARDARVPVESPRVDGSIALKGARFDDLSLKDYRQTTDHKSPEIVLLSPRASEEAYYATFGWSAPADAKLDLPGLDTPWELVSGTTLSPSSPVTLRWTNPQGLVFTRTIALDANYMFTITDEVQNTSSNAVALAPFGLVARHTKPPQRSTYILHEGLLGVFNAELEQVTYKKMIEEREKRFTPERPGGWLGITDKYWMTALIPEQTEKIAGRFMEQPLAASGLYQTDYLGAVRTLAPGAKTQITNRLFAGAKEVSVTNGYEKDLGVARFDLAIDWGWFPFLTKPMFWLLDHYNNLGGNFGIAILLLTVTVKLLFFPLANKSYEAMSKMKKLQPEMTRLRDVHKDDKVKQQQEIMELYKKEKVNPLAGCLPIFVQIPVFFALYKVLYITIEMRHAPFFGWIQDLSAPDPTTVFNLFGLIPWDPTTLPFVGSLLHIGVWPLLMGFTMFLQTSMQPAQADPTQQKVFALMPVIFTFMLATFPAGLVIYWTWNNSLSILQQYVIMKRMKVDMEWDKKFGPLVRLYRALTGQKGDNRGGNGPSRGSRQPGE